MDVPLVLQVFKDDGLPKYADMPSEYGGTGALIDLNIIDPSYAASALI